ncbi:SDR family NAD(P)-dependent oxidoreductase [Microbaculum marinum]|uniref:SDR family oxidoreductase n=1 Tax=Microbaculum marinum TaxID=1764581 RepID=A0AAW9RRH0_9HYPH
MAWQANFDDLRGRKVLVTGASSGIGAAVAAAFGACGAEVGIHYFSNEAGARSVAAEIEADGGKAHVFQADLTKPDQHGRLADEALGALGGLDILINNAGEIIERRAFADMDDAFYSGLFDLNVRSVVGLTGKLLPALSDSDAASIITTTSFAVHTGGAQGTSLYAATKGALYSFTIGLAKELGPRGIRVNAVAPSIILTPLHDGITSQETLDRISGLVPLGRLGTTEDCIGAFLYLASPRLAGYVSGITIDITGARV